MAGQHLLPSLAFMIVAVAAVPSQKGTPCDFTGFDSYATVSRILAKMPPSTKPAHNKFSAVFPGFELGELIVSGLPHLEQYGPVHPFCVNGSRLLQVDLIHRRDVTMSMEWRSCSGMQGNVTLRAELSRFTVLFRLSDSGVGNGTALSFVAPVAPVTLEGAQVGVEGANRAMKIVTGVLSNVFEGVVREAYNQLFFSTFYGALQRVLH